MKGLAIVVATLVALVLPASASAITAPTLLSVSHVKRHPEARWTLPQYVDAGAVEVATRPETASDGSFFTENITIFDVVNETDTHWLYGSQLDPGRYYVHVRGWDNSCLHTDFQTECGSAWSNALPLTIPKPSPPPYRPRFFVTFSALQGRVGCGMVSQAFLWSEFVCWRRSDGFYIRMARPLTNHPRVTTGTSTALRGLRPGTQWRLASDGAWHSSDADVVVCRPSGLQITCRHWTRHGFVLGLKRYQILRP